jgi:hypothetical protein
MKKYEKMSFANVKSKLTRKEMSNIMAGSSGAAKTCGKCYSAYDCASNCSVCRGGNSGSGACEAYT